ncbi:MAG: LCP family protein [Acidimicrobiia bacterium]|nr:LCP family protein [Acidimicrobiia bacterium]
MTARRSPLRAFTGRFGVAFLTAVLFMGGAIFAVNYVIDTKLDAVARVKVSVADAPPEGANYLLIGSDTRAFVDNPGEQEAFGDSASTGGQRSDTMMILHVEPDAQKTLIVSFPRDLWVDIPGIGSSKINAAFSKGPNKTVEMLKANFGIDINHYLEVDFRSFRGIVNAIGEVPVYFPYPARDEKTGLDVAQPGCVRLDGDQALSYVRSRSLEYYSVPGKKWVSADLVPDIDRIARQQDFMRKLAGLAVLKGLNNPLTANEITDRVLEKLKIDEKLTKEDIFGLIDAFRTVNPNDTSSLEFVTLPWLTGPDQKGQSVLYTKEPDASSLIARLQDFTANKAGQSRTVAPTAIQLRVLNGTGNDGTAAGAIAALTRLGFVGAGTGNDARGSVAVSEVRYKPGAIDKGKSVLRYLKPNARLVEDSSIRGADAVIVLGADFESIVEPSVAATPTSTTPTTAPATLVPVPDASGTPAPISNEKQLGTPAPRTAPC